MHAPIARCQDASLRGATARVPRSRQEDRAIIQIPLHYEHPKHVEADRIRDSARLGHLRELQAGRPTVGIVSRIVGHVAVLRRAVSRRAPVAYDPHELTDYVCRLPDGAMGRVAIRQSEGEWIGVCVAAP